MKRFAAIAASIVITCLLACGCTNSETPIQTNGSTNIEAANSENSSLSLEQENEIVLGYVSSQEFTNLFDVLSRTTENLMGAVESSDVSQLDNMLIELTSAANELDKIEVPEPCKDIDRNIELYTRSLAVSIGDYSDFLQGIGGEEKLDEAIEYFDMATGFANDLDASLQELIDRLNGQAAQ